MKVLKGSLVPLILKKMIIKQKTISGTNDANRYIIMSFVLSEERRVHCTEQE